MTATAPAPGMRAERGKPGVPGAAPGQQITPPPKMRRRPAMIALSIACIAVGGIASAWAWQATSSTTGVLTVNDTVARGEVITAEDLLPVQVGVDPALQAVPASQIENVIGQTAVLDIVKGSLLTPAQFRPEAYPAEGNSIVGVSLAAGLLPDTQVDLGDKVRVVTTGDAAEGTDQSEGIAVEGVIRSLTTDQVTGNSLADVEIAGSEAVRVAAAAAAGNVALILEHQSGESASADESVTDPTTETEVDGETLGAPALDQATAAKGL